MTAGMEPAWRRSVAGGKWPVDSRPPWGPQPEPGSAEAWWALYQTRCILGAAPLEGAAFFQLIAYYLEGLPLYLGLAGGLLVLLLLRFPTRHGVESWVTAQREMVEVLKQDQM